MKNILFAIAIASTILACASRSYNAGQSAAKDESGLIPLGEWTNPVATATEPRNDPSRPNLDVVGEGLTLVGMDDAPIRKLNVNKPTVIYIHGWTPGGDVPSKVFNKTWHDQYNTFYFRWHRTSFMTETELGGEVLAGGDIRIVAQKLLSKEFDRLYSALGRVQYSQEIRLVGFSLGTFLAARLASESTAFDPLKRGQRRVDLLESFLVNKSENQVYCNGTAILDSRYTEKNQRFLEDAARNAAVTGYETGIGGIAARLLWKTVNHVQFHSRWLGTESIETQHVSLVPMYFESINEKSPVTATGEEVFSAATPTKKILELNAKTGRAHFVQNAETKSLHLSDASFVRETHIDPQTVGLRVDQWSICKPDGSRLFDSSILQLGKWTF